MDMKKNKPVVWCDPIIITRVKKYLEDNVEKTYVDVGTMAKNLMERYPEYSRRKFAPFRALVEQAYRIVSQSYGMDSQLSSSSEDDASSVELMDAQPPGLMNRIMHNLYANKKSTNNATVGAKSPRPSTSDGPIDIISSGESDNEDNNATNGKPAEKDNNAKATNPNKGLRVVAAHRLSNEPSISKILKTPSASLPPGEPAQKRSEACGDAQSTKKRRLEDLGKSATTDFNANLNASASKPEKKNRMTSPPRSRHPATMKHPAATKNAMPYYETGRLHDMLAQNKPHSSYGRPRRFKKEVNVRRIRERFQDVGGMEKTLKELCEVLLHIKTPDIYFSLGLMPPRGILLHGPSGCGKTLLAHAICGQLNFPLIEVPATELVAGISGESEERIREVFEQAMLYSPCVLFIDEIDAISSNRLMAQKDMERRIVSQLISSMDGLKDSEEGQAVLVIGATTRPDVLDPALRRVGRFDHEILIGIPSRKDRKEILNIICDELSVEKKLDFDKIAELTPGYVGADLLALVSRTATIAVKRKCSEQMRAIQVQRNITFVNLDDDVDENEPATAVQVQKEEAPQELNKDAEKAATDVDEEVQTVDTPSPVAVDHQPQAAQETAVKEAAEKNVNGDVVMQEGSTEKAKDQVETETTVEEKLQHPAETTTVSRTDQDADANKVKLDAKKPVGPKTDEPTLFELLTWLDNPPQELSSVSQFCLTLDDFLEAVKVVQPSAKREGFITVPDVTWNDVGSMQDIREELRLAVLAPVKHPEKLERLGLTAPSGVLLCGPPGCGKTLIAKAIANEAGINFISVKGPEMMNMYVGESERAVRACFQRARNSAPCVVFFDEFDSLCQKRSKSSENGSGTRIVNQLLTEMDGVEERKGVYILAATNRPDIIDPAILRPGRLDTILYVGLPDVVDRREIFVATTKNRTCPILAEDVSFDELARLTDGYSGADLAGLVKQAAMQALKESIDNPADTNDDLCVKNSHFQQAIKLLRPSISATDRKVYEKLRLKYAAPRGLAERSISVADFPEVDTTLDDLPVVDVIDEDLIEDNDAIPVFADDAMADDAMADDAMADDTMADDVMADDE